MELRSIRYFLAVADELHFGRAAKRLHMSQPPLSQQIIKLEEELDIALFIRDKRNVKLTKAGENFVRHCQNVLSLIDYAVEDARAVSRGKSGLVSIGYVGPAMDSCLPSFLRNFKKTYPAVKVVLKHLNTKTQLEQIQKGLLDVGFLRFYGQEPKNLQLYPVHKETYLAAVPIQHPYAEKEQIAINEIVSEPLIFYPRSIQPDLYDTWLKIFRKTGKIPHIAEEAESYQTILSLVAAGFGLAIVPESTTQQQKPGVTTVAIKDNIPELVITACHLKNTDNPVVNSFIDYILENSIE